MRSLASNFNRWQAFFLAFIVTLAAPGILRAEDEAKTPEAKAYSDLLKRAKLAADNNKIAEAIGLWGQAWKLSQHWHLPCNIGEGHFLLQTPDKAATYLSRCLKLAPFPKTEKAAAHRRRIRAMLENALDHVSVIVITATQGARVSVDGEHKGTAPLSEEVFLMPGNHRFIAELNGRIVSRTLNTNRKEKYSVDLAFPHEQAEPVQPNPIETKPIQPKAIENKPVEMARSVPMALNADPSAWGKRWMPSIILLGAGGVLASAGGLLLLKADNYQERARDIAAIRNAMVGQPSEAECMALTSRFNEARNRQSKTHNTGVFSFGAAGVLGIAGLVYPWLPIHGKNTSVAISPSGAFLFGNF